MACLPTECRVGDCGRPARRAGLCWGHLKRSQRGQALVELTPRNTAPERRLLEAVLDFGDAEDSGEDVRRAWDRVRKAVRSYVGHAPWAPRPRHKAPGRQLALSFRGVCHLAASSARNALREAVAAVWDADASDDAEWAAAMWRLRVTARRYVLSEKPNNPNRRRVRRD